MTNLIPVGEVVVLSSGKERGRGKKWHRRVSCIDFQLGVVSRFREAPATKPGHLVAGKWVALGLSAFVI